MAFRIAAFTARLYSSSGRCALVENAKEFILVPWWPVIERSLGREVIWLITAAGFPGRSVETEGSVFEGLGCSTQHALRPNIHKDMFI